MKSRFLVFLVLALVLLLFSGVFAQGFFTFLMETTEQLDSICGGTGHPVADGTTVLIYWDSDSNGPSANDPLATVCNNPPDCLDGPAGTVNYNSFTVNGNALGLLPGQFYSDPYGFASVGVLPTPNRFYLVICLPTRHYVSNVISPAVGLSEIEMGPWTCVSGTCGSGPVPDPATNPRPADLATGVALNATLAWTPGAGATSHDVYFGTTNPPPFAGNQTSTTYNPGTMTLGTIYHWRIDERNAAGVMTGTLWQFTAITPPGPATNPLPSNLATGVAVNATLAWTPGAGVTSHDVYFGTTNPPPFVSNQTIATYTPGSLARSTIYYWKINEGSSGGVTPGTVWSFRTICGPASEPISESFSGPGLDSCWSWLREDNTHHSLAARPGWMRITTQGGEVASDAKNILLRPRMLDDFMLETRLAFTPTTNYQQAGLVLWLDSTRNVLFHRYYSAGQKLIFRGDHSPGGYDFSTYIADSDTNLYLRLSVDGTLVTASYSTNGTAWTSVASHDFSWMNDSVQVGVFACNGGYAGYSAPQIRADFDYVSVQRNCPRNVSGTWTLSHSPYQVYCTNIVPAGQTLTIEPGVEVRFEADAELRVEGRLLADGTAQDSIKFWADTVSNPNRWGGVRFNHAQGENRLTYCKFLNASNTTSDTYQEGGAVYNNNSLLTVRHCLFAFNRAQYGAGILMDSATSGSRIDTCTFTANRSVDNSMLGAGGAVTLWDAPVPINCCLFAHNRAHHGGAVEITVTTSSVTRCTFVDNIASQIGSVGYSWAGHQQYNSCIFYQNGTAPLFRLDGGSSASVVYTDVADRAGGFSNGATPSGFGVKMQMNVNGDSVDTYHNLFSNPLFADTITYALNINSDCINAGDVAYPKDLDDSYADMGYLWTNQFPPCIQQVQGTWTLAQSPYLISCNYLVPSGQMLTIQPGVQVKFLGDYELIVDGSLIAQGTAADSITFWADPLTNPALWMGVRFNHAQGENRLSYCKFLNGSCITGNVYQLGGAVFADSSLVTIAHCLFENNQAQWGGAVNFSNALTGSRLDSSVFISNYSDNNGAGGAASLTGATTPVRNCLFAHNSGTYGGALALRSGSVERCTFVDNTATTCGGIAYLSNGSHTFNSCIFSQNGNTPLFQRGASISVTVDYSDVQDMSGGFSNYGPPPGFGVKNHINVNGDSVDTFQNMFLNPHFADLNDYELAWDSRCVDAGDPLLSHDPDTTISDQGWKPYYQPTLVAGSSNLNFGQVLIGDSVEIDLSLTNTSPARARLAGYCRWYNCFTVDYSSFPAWVPPNSTITLHVFCRPDTEGVYDDALTIWSRLAGPDSILVPLHARVPYLPVDPESLVVKPGANGDMVIHWTAVTHSSSGHPITPTYYIYGSNSASGHFDQIATSNTNSYTHVGIGNSLPKYFYRVTAVSDAVVLSAPPTIQKTKPIALQQ